MLNLRRSALGFTMVELMVTLTIVAIALYLAVPTFRTEKRQTEAAAQEIQNFVTLAQTLAVKRNENVAFRWWAESTGHAAEFCFGISSPPKTVPCDCRSVRG